MEGIDKLLNCIYMVLLQSQVSRVPTVMVPHLKGLKYNFFYSFSFNFM